MLNSLILTVMLATTNFSQSEWMTYNEACTGTHKMQSRVMVHIQELRDYMNVPLVLTSAYRCPEHPIEARKVKPGQHSKGLAVDIYVSNGFMAAKIIKFALTNLDVTGFSYSKKMKFVHLDWRKGKVVTWNY